MRLSGDATLHGPVERVYAALNDPAVLVRTIPGCERLERVGPDEYRMVVTAGVATIRGTYAGQVRLTDHDAPHSFVLKASGTGGPGTVSADVTVRLAPGEDGSTTLTYDADAVIGGVIGGVGQRMLSSVARRTAGEFFAAVDSVLAGGGALAAVEPEVFARPPVASRPGDFTTGVLVGAAAALLGALVGGLVAARARRR